MISRVVGHARHNAVGYVALFLVLGGTSNAAVHLKAGSVGTKQLKNGAVTTPKIANGAVTNPKLANGAVTNPKLANGAVTLAKIAPSASAALRSGMPIKLFLVADVGNDKTLASLPGGLNIDSACVASGGDLVVDSTAANKSNWLIDASWQLGDVGQLEASVGNVVNSTAVSGTNGHAILGYTGGATRAAVGTAVIERSIGSIWTVSYTIEGATFTAPGENAPAYHCVYRGTVTPGN